MRPDLPPHAELEAMLTKALADRGLASHQSKLVSPAAALLFERADLATRAAGASRFGCPPDLPESTWCPRCGSCPPTSRAVTHGLSAALAEAYGALHASLRLPRLSR